MCDTEVVHNFLLMTFGSKVEVQSQFKKNIFQPLPIKSYHGISNRGTILRSTSRTLTTSKIASRQEKSWHDFVKKNLSCSLVPKSRHGTKIVARLGKKFWKYMTVTTKSRHGKTQPWRDFLPAYKKPSTFITAIVPFSYCYSAKISPEIQTTKFTKFKPTSNILNHHQHQIHLTFFIPKP